MALLFPSQKEKGISRYRIYGIKDIRFYTDLFSFSGLTSAIMERMYIKEE